MNTAIETHGLTKRFGERPRHRPALSLSPASRTSLVGGKALAAGPRSLTQAAIVYAFALLLGVHVIFDPLRIAGVGLAVILGSAAFAMFSLSSRA